MGEPRLERVLSKTEDLRVHKKWKREKFTSSYKLSFFFGGGGLYGAAPLQFYRKYDILVAGLKQWEPKSLLNMYFTFELNLIFKYG